MAKAPLAIVILVTFVVSLVIGPLPSYAQDYYLPSPGVMVHLSPPLNPPILKGIKVHPDNPFKFDFILDRGDSELNSDQLKEESSKLIKYFLASLTIPEKDLWVNLSPYEKDRIIPNSFGLTEMGRDLLAEDYMLKQITASLIYPEDEIGKKFWKRVYEVAAKKYGTTNLPVNTFNKVWIVPEKAVVYENAKAGTAYVVESKLKIMLEQDYLSLSKHEGIQSQPLQVKDTSQLGSEIVREIVIPELTTEVNENKNFVHLRQVYNSLILATWYKKKIKDSILEQVYADKNKVAGVNIDDPQEKERIYQKYLRAFKKGVFNYIKEDKIPCSFECNGGDQQIVARKYFSGGFNMAMTTVDAGGILRISKVIPSAAMISPDKAILINEDTVVTGQDKAMTQESGNEEGNLPMMVLPPAIHIGMRITDTHGSFTSQTRNFHFSWSSTNVVSIADINDHTRVAGIVGEERLSRGIDRGLAMSLLWDTDDVHNIQNVSKLFRYLISIFGEEFLQQEDSGDIFDLAHKLGEVKFSGLYASAKSLFGEPLLKNKNGVILMQLLNEEGEDKLGPIVEAIRGIWGPEADNFMLNHFKELIEAVRAIRERGGSDDTIINFVSQMRERLPSSLFEQMLMDPNLFLQIVRKLETFPGSNIFRSFQFISRYMGNQDWQNSHVIWNGSFDLFAQYDFDNFRESLAGHLGADIVNHLFSVTDINDFRPILYLPSEFFLNPDEFLSGIRMKPESLRLFFRDDWVTVANLIKHKDDIARINFNHDHDFDYYFDELRSRLPAEFIDLLLPYDSIFKLLGTMKEVNVEILQRDFLSMTQDWDALQSGSRTEELAAAISHLEAMTNFGHEGMADAHILLRQYYLSTLNYMVSSGMLRGHVTEAQWRGLVLNILVDTLPLENVNNAFSNFKFGLELIRSFNGETPLVLLVVAHEIAHRFFGRSEFKADLWSFGFLYNLANDVQRAQGPEAAERYRDAVRKFQEHEIAGYGNIIPKNGPNSAEIHDVGRWAVRSLMDAVMTFDGTYNSHNVPWNELAERMLTSLADYDALLARNIFIQHVGGRLNSAQQEFVEETGNLEKALKDLPGFAQELKDAAQLISSKVYKVEDDKLYKDQSSEDRAMIKPEELSELEMFKGRMAPEDGALEHPSEALAKYKIAEGLNSTDASLHEAAVELLLKEDQTFSLADERFSRDTLSKSRYSDLLHVVWIPTDDFYQKYTKETGGFVHGYFAFLPFSADLLSAIHESRHVDSQLRGNIQDEVDAYMGSLTELIELAHLGYERAVQEVRNLAVPINDREKQLAEKYQDDMTRRAIVLEADRVRTRLFYPHYSLQRRWSRASDYNLHDVVTIITVLMLDNPLAYKIEGIRVKLLTGGISEYRALLDRENEVTLNSDVAPQLRTSLTQRYAQYDSLHHRDTQNAEQELMRMLYADIAAYFDVFIQTGKRNQRDSADFMDLALGFNRDNVIGAIQDRSVQENTEMIMNYAAAIANEIVSNSSDVELYMAYLLQLNSIRDVLGFVTWGSIEHLALVSHDEHEKFVADLHHYMQENSQNNAQLAQDQAMSNSEVQRKWWEGMVALIKKPSLTSSNIKIVFRSIDGLIAKATVSTLHPFNAGDDVGIPKFLEYSRKPYRWLPTRSIGVDDLPPDYPMALRDANFTKNLPGYIHVNLPKNDIFLASFVYNGSRGVVRLGWLDNGTPVAIKASYSGSIDYDNTLISNHFNEVLTVDREGIGPRLHGKFIDKYGRINIVMDIVPGEMTKGAKDFITPVTVADFIEIHRRLSQGGYSMNFDFQYLITPAGRILLIDPEGINRKDLDINDQLYLRNLSNLLENANPEVQTQSLQNLLEEDPVLLNSLREFIVQNMHDYSFHKKDPQKITLLEAIESVLANRGMMAKVSQLGNTAVHRVFFNNKENKKKVGGIDLTAANMHLQTRNNGGEIKFHLDPAMLQKLQNAPGFVPVIINVQPLRNLSQFLGLNQDAGMTGH